MLACEQAHRFVRTGLKIESRRSGNCSVCNGEWDLFPPLLCYTSSTRFRALRSAIFFCPFFPTRGPGSRLMKMCANVYAANAPPRERSNRYVCKFTLGANVHGRHGRNVFTARVIGSCEWQIIPTLYLEHNLDGKFPIVRAKQMPALIELLLSKTADQWARDFRIFNLYRYHTTGQFPLNVPYSRSFYARYKHTYPIWGDS